MWNKQRAWLKPIHQVVIGLVCGVGISHQAIAAPTITAQPVESTTYIGESASFSVSATGSGALSYQWLRNGADIVGATGSGLVFTATTADDGALYSVSVTDNAGATTSDAVELIVDFGMPGAAYTNRVINITDTWRYNVNNINLGTTWRDTGYSDGTWPSGGGLLYVESSSLPASKTTPLPLSGGSLPSACYFRSWFTHAPTDFYSADFIVDYVVDDGLILYLNGVEIDRPGMPAGAVSHGTLATTTVGDAEYSGPIVIPVTNLVNGSNLIAAEVHQSSVGSSDIVMGMTLDVIWRERLRDTAAPVVLATSPTAGSAVSSLTQIQVTFDEGVQGVDATDLLINGAPADSVTPVSTSVYQFSFAAPVEGLVTVTWAPGHGIADRSADAHVFAGAGFSYFFTPPSPYSELAFASVRQSSDASGSTMAGQAVDNSAGTHSLTQDLPDSHWVGDLGRPHVIERIEVVNRSAPDDAGLDGLTLMVMNMDDQVVHQTTLSNPGSGGIAVVYVPAGTVGRSVKIGLTGSEVNGLGNQQVGLAEVRVIGEHQIPYMPEPYSSGGGNDVQYSGFSVSQSTDLGGSYPASAAVDDNSGSFSHTDQTTQNNYWLADLGAEGLVARVELVNRAHASSASRMDNLVIRVLDAGMNTVASDVTTNPGSGATYIFSPPANTMGRYVKVGLENGETNGRNDYAIVLAEVRIYSEAVDTSPPMPTANLATGQRSYMLRLTDALPLASNANDGDMSTETYTTSQTVDGYWEVDLGATYALYGVRAVTASAVGDRLASTTCRLFDENHDSVLERPLTGEAPAYDVDVDGPVFARYVRVGLEDKTRTDGNAGGFIGFSEVEVFGRPASEVGIMTFSASDTSVSSDQDVTLNWGVEDVARVELHPGMGSVGSSTDTNGIGSLVQNMTASTEFILVATNNAGVFTRAMGVEVNGVALPVVISEIVADSKYSLEDGYGDAPDWIELRNTGNSTVDLTGWGLSDNPEKPMKFVFPATNIAPHSTIVVFASKEETPIDPAGMLHADFSLDKDGETLVLTAADGVSTLDSVAYPELDTDLAYGRSLDGGWAYMEPTPDAVNTGATYDGWMDTLNWSHARGFYETNFTLTVTSNDPSATILYSLDGTEPSVPYVGGLSITGTSIVRVQAVWPGYKPARIQTKSFIFLDDVIADLDTVITEDPTYGPRVKPGLLALPTLSLVVSSTGDAIDAIEYDEQACSLEIIGLDGQSPIQEDCGISRFGGAYSYFEKKAFSLAFRQQYGNGKLKAPLFNGFDRGVLARTSFDRLHLRGGNHDWSRAFGMSDRFIQDSYLDMGSLNPHGRYVHVYLNGEYWGQYNLKEVLNEAFLADYLGGEEDDYVSVKGNDNGGGGPGGWVIGAGDPPNPEPWEKVRADRNDFEAVSPYLDVSHYIDYMLLYGFGGSENEFRACGPKEAGSGFKFWINDPDGFVNDGRVDHDKSIGTWGPGGIWDGLHSENHPDFKTLLADRIYKNFFNDGAMTHAQCSARLQARMDETYDSFLAECGRWGRSYTSRASSANTAYTSYFNHQASDMVAAWRSAGYLPSFDPPTFDQYGGPVISGHKPTLSSGSGTIYYTLDGTDPRLPGGGISSSALVWSPGAVTVTGDITITSRVRSGGGTWSALAEPRYTLSSRREPLAGDLLITEINYNPASEDDYEFIEIWNPGPDFLDLSGASVSNGVRYIFPEGTSLDPGDFIVIAEDAIAFAERYQNPASTWYWSGAVLDGEWVGGLSDGGERLDLRAADGSLVSTVRYRNDGDWPERPNGDGSSLQMANPAAAPSDIGSHTNYLADGRNWEASALYHGSPGRFDPAGNGVVISEILSHTDVGVDWVELWNTSGDPVDLTGLAVTDDLAWPDRYVIPSTPTLPAGGFMTISASVLGYGFSELGAEASVLELSGTDIVRFVDRVTFPAAEREEPFGRHARSDGRVDFTELFDITPLASNEAPRVGPVVISEIMFAPALGDPEYIEIVNISGVPVALYDSAIPTNTWDLTGVGDMAFPEGTVLDPAEVAILCSTNPAVFRARHGLPMDVQVFGPWSGGLALEGEKLRLRYPGDPELDGFVPMYRMDHVSYRTNDSWAVANTGGISLERWTLDTYGNDPASWKASRFGGTPGSAFENTYPMGIMIRSGGANPGISFNAIIGESYEVQFSESLKNPDWDPLLAIPSATTNWIEAIDPIPSPSARYYRIIWNQ